MGARRGGMGRWRCRAATRPEGAQDYYQYLLAHHQTDGRTETWTWTGSRSPGCGGSSSAIDADPHPLGLCSTATTLSAERRHLPGRQLGRLHTEAAGPASLFFFVLVTLGRRPRSPPCSSSATSSGGRCSDGERSRCRSSRTRRSRRWWSAAGEWEHVVRLAAGAQGSRPGVPRLPALRRLHPRRGRR